MEIERRVVDVPKKKILISIIIPFFNCHNKVDIFIKSMIKQDLDDVELIFIDDGSTDEGGKFISESLCELSIEFQIVRKENRGVASARNDGLNRVRGEYVMFIDSDDALLNCAISVIKRILAKSPPVNCLMFEYLRLSEVGRYKALRYSTIEKNIVELDVGRILKNYINGGLLQKLHMCSCLYQVEHLKKNNLKFDECFAYGEDQKFVIECLATADTVSYHHFPVLAYIDYASSATGIFSLKWFHSYEMFKSLYAEKRFCKYKAELEKRMNGELLSISNKVINTTNFVSSTKFLNAEICPKIISTCKPSFWLLCKFPYIYVLFYKLYKTIIR